MLYSVYFNCLTFIDESNSPIFFFICQAIATWFLSRYFQKVLNNFIIIIQIQKKKLPKTLVHGILSFP